MYTLLRPRSTQCQSKTITCWPGSHRRKKVVGTLRLWTFWSRSWWSFSTLHLFDTLSPRIKGALSGLFCPYSMLNLIIYVWKLGDMIFAYEYIFCDYDHVNTLLASAIDIRSYIYINHANRKGSGPVVSWICDQLDPSLCTILNYP
jgi:hypothetical protein